MAIEEESSQEAGGHPRPAAVADTLSASVTGERVDVRDSLVVAAAAGEMTARDTLVVVGAVGELKGDARVLLDVPAALAFGAAFGLALGLFLRLLGRGVPRESSGSARADL